MANKHKSHIHVRPWIIAGCLGSLVLVARPAAAQTGACCLADANCAVTDKKGCGLFEGEFLGPDTSCAEVTCTGACCLPEKQCFEGSREECGAGSFQGAGSVCATHCGAPLGTAFTYQGQLNENGLPVADTIDVEARLWTALLGGEPVGDPIVVTSVPVINGLFSIDLDFGPDAFPGNARYLELAVRRPHDPTELEPFTTLTPRQPLQPAPFSIFSMQGTWEGLGDVPTGFADDVDNDTQYAAGEGLTLDAGTFHVKFGFNGSDTTAARSDHLHDDRYYKKTELSGNGTANVHWNNLSSIPSGFADNVDDDTTYTAGTGLTLAGTQFSADFAGAGSADTIARSDHTHNPSSLFSNTIVVSAAGTPTENGEALRDAVDRIFDASANNPYVVKLEPGVYDVRSNSLVVKDYVSLVGSGETNTRIAGRLSGTGGWVVSAGIQSEIRFLTVENTGDRSSSGRGRAIRFDADSLTESLRLVHVTAIASGSDTHRTIDSNGGTILADHVTAIATGGNIAEAVRQFEGEIILTNSRLEATGALQRNRALSNTANSGTFSSQVSHSELIASGASANAVVNDSEYHTFFSFSTLSPSPNNSSTRITCVAVTDPDFRFFADTCP